MWDERTETPEGDAMYDLERDKQAEREVTYQLVCVTEDCPNHDCLYETKPPNRLCPFCMKAGVSA